MPFPLVNVFTKIDNLSRIGETLPFNLDYYTEVQDLDYMLPHLEAEQTGKQPSLDPAASPSKLTGLNEALIGLVQDFGLVGFETLAVEDKTSMMSVLRAIDRAGGYVFGSEKGANDTVWQMSMQEGWTGKMDVRDVQERWIDRKEEFDEMERRMWEEEARLANPPTETRTDLGVQMTRKPPTASANADADDEDLDAQSAKFMQDLKAGGTTEQASAKASRKT